MSTFVHKSNYKILHFIMQEIIKVINNTSSVNNIYVQRVVKCYIKYLGVQQVPEVWKDAVVFHVPKSNTQKPLMILDQWHAHQL